MTEANVSVVCPVYNEAENILTLFDRLRVQVSIVREVVVVYDRDDDTTLPVLNQLSDAYPFEIRAEKNLFGRGALNAIRTGFRLARGPAVLVLMADLSDDLSVVGRMYEMIETGGFDIVCGSRYMPGGRQVGGPWLKGTLSRIAGLSLHYLAGIPTHDVTNSFKMYRSDLLKQTEIESRGGFELGMELVVKAYASGKRIGEVPSVWQDRVAGKSRFRLWKWAPSYLRWYFFAFKQRLRV